VETVERILDFYPVGVAFRRDKRLNGKLIQPKRTKQQIKKSLVTR